MKIKAYLGIPALMSIIASSIEVYKKEALGYLVGTKGENKFLINYAIPYQSAKATFSQVEVDEDKINEINTLLSTFTEIDSLRYLGDFHSHSNSPIDPDPSEDDLQSSNPGEIYLICAVNPKLRIIKWHVNASGILVGTIGKYKIKIRAYCVSAKRKLISAEIKCPALTRC